MNTSLKKIFTPLLIINYLLLIICCTACENSEQEVNAFTQKKTGIEEATDVNILYSTDGKAKAKLTSPKLYRYQTDSVLVEFPQKIHVDFFDTTARVENKLDAKHAKYYETQNSVLLKDSVQLVTRKGDTLNTTELHWDQIKAIFYTDKPIKIRQRDKILNGVGLMADQMFNWYTINNIQGVVLVSDSLVTDP